METNTFLPYVQAFEQLLAQGRQLQPGAMALPRLPAVDAQAPTCLLFSPHPDDEVITGGLPWRLRHQAGWSVVNVAVTLGSNPGRREARWSELRACCAHLGFELHSASGETSQGLERILAQTADQEPAHWGRAVDRVADLLVQYQPRIIVCPHANDGHATHIGTHHLVMDALRHVGGVVRPHVLLTEYWNSLPDPALMVELSARDVAELMTALSLHVGEVARNPYHLTLPAWCMDAVRRGAERVGVPGAVAPDFSFAMLYGWLRWTGSHATPVRGQFLPQDAAPGGLFEP